MPSLQFGNLGQGGGQWGRDFEEAARRAKESCVQPESEYGGEAELGRQRNSTAPSAPPSTHKRSQYLVLHRDKGSCSTERAKSTGEKSQSRVLATAKSGHMPTARTRPDQEMRGLASARFTVALAGLAEVLNF